jgi:thymidylate kinase
MKMAAGRKGKVITFSGVDGAGKTTVLKNVQQVIEKEYRQKVVLKRHRPSVLPIISSLFYGKAKAEAKVTAHLPRQGNNKNMVSSLLRFSYYYIDYLLGQLYLYFRYTLWGTHILYDRYFFDFIVDSRRSNIKINPKFAKKLYQLVYKPDFNFFLFASPEQILARKQELKKEDIVSLTENYQALFKAFQQPERYQCIENLQLESTLDKIKNTINLN